MYTLGTLQEKLEEAKSNLREVENNIFKADGKPTFNAGTRYYKQNNRQERPADNTGPPRRRVFELLGEYNTSGRKRVVVDESGPKRRGADDDNQGRRKRSFSDKEDAIVDESPVRKKPFQSVFGQPKLLDNNESFQRGRREKERDFEKPRSVFSRLSGFPQIPQYYEEAEAEDEDEEIIQRRQPVVPSQVLAVEHPTPSREEVISAEKQDVARKQRDRRMFGALMGTLKQFCREETQVKEKEEQRLKIEKKVEEEAIREKERIKEEKQSLQVEKRRREADIKRIEWSLNRVKEYAAWEANVLMQRNFIMTKSSPQIFYLPKTHCPASENLLQESAKSTQETIDKRLASLNAEIEASEKKALRAAGKLVDDKENEDRESHKEEKETVRRDIDDEDEEEEEEAWEESQYEGLQLVEPEGPELTNETKMDDSENFNGTETVVVKEEKLPEMEVTPKVSITDEPNIDSVEKEGSDESLNQTELPVETEIPSAANDTVPLPAQSPAEHKSPSPSKQTNDVRSKSKSRSKTPQKKATVPHGGAKSPAKKTDRRASRSERKSRSPSKKESSGKQVKDTKSQSGRTRSPVRRSRRSGSRSQRRSGRTRSRSGQKRRPRRSRTPDRRRRSRSDRRRKSPRRDNRRSASPRKRRRSRSSSSSSSSSSTSSSSSSSDSGSDRKK